jgi:hypothetical protein
VDGLEIRRGGRNNEKKEKEGRRGRAINPFRTKILRTGL